MEKKWFPVVLTVVFVLGLLITTSIIELDGYRYLYKAGTPMCFVSGALLVIWYFFKKKDE